jgi:lipopolysaccharide transport system ATP-binding protein
MPQIAKVCRNAAVMDKGSLVYLGDDVEEGIGVYNGLFNPEQGSVLGSGVEMNLFEFYTQTSLENNDLVELGYRDDLSLKLKYEIDKKYKYYDIVLGISDQESRCVAAVTSEVICNRGDKTSVKLNLPNMMLSPGRYLVTLSFHGVDPDSGGRTGIICSFKDTKTIEVSGGQTKTGVPFTLSGDWYINGLD